MQGAGCQDSKPPMGKEGQAGRPEWGLDELQPSSGVSSHFRWTPCNSQAAMHFNTSQSADFPCHNMPTAELFFLSLPALCMAKIFSGKLSNFLFFSLIQYAFEKNFSYIFLILNFSKYVFSKEKSFNTTGQLYTYKNSEKYLKATCNPCEKLTKLRKFGSLYKKKNPRMLEKGIYSLHYPCAGNYPALKPEKGAVVESLQMRPDGRGLWQSHQVWVNAAHKTWRDR